MKKIWEWLKAPKIWWAIIVFALFAAEIVGVVLLLRGSGTAYSVFAYVLYALSAITLAYIAYCIVYFAPKAKSSITNTMQRYTFTRKLTEQYSFRTIIFAIVSFIINLGFVVYNGVMGFYYRSFWFGALGVYYLLLATMRGGVLAFHRRKNKGTAEQMKIRETITYAVCGGWLLILPLALSAVVWVMYATKSVFVHSGYMIYLFAAYAFYKIIMSVINFVKARKEDEMTVRAIRNVNLADALVSLFALQTAMFNEFSPEANLGFGNAVMGAVVCAITAAIGLIMTVSGAKKTIQLRGANENVR